VVYSFWPSSAAPANVTSPEFSHAHPVAAFLTLSSSHISLFGHPRQADPDTLLFRVAPRPGQPHGLVLVPSISVTSAAPARVVISEGDVTYSIVLSAQLKPAFAKVAAAFASHTPQPRFFPSATKRVRLK
jgi:hypothetical protein